MQGGGRAATKGIATRPLPGECEQHLHLVECSVLGPVPLKRKKRVRQHGMGKAPEWNGPRCLDDVEQDERRLEPRVVACGEGGRCKTRQRRVPHVGMLTGILRPTPNVRRWPGAVWPCVVFGVAMATVTITVTVTVTVIIITILIIIRPLPLLFLLALLLRLLLLLLLRLLLLFILLLL